MSETERIASYRGGYDAGYTKGHEDGYNAALNAQEQNEPLTWEQIAERVGKPVCDCHGNDYRIVAWADTESKTIIFTDGTTIRHQDGVTAFYAHEPKGEAK